MRLGFVVVHYRAAEWVARAVRAILEDVGGGGAPGVEIVVVDNGSDEEERALLGSLPVRLLAAKRNLGYAGGINRGVAALTADVYFALNPDVVVLPGCVDALVAQLERGAAAAGPRFYWDEDRQFLLPPTEERTRRSEIAACLAGRSDRLAAWARRRWRRHARRFWLAADPFATPALSGALLAFRRDALERVGPFDESYQLYFEENEWLLRLRRHGLKSWFVPAAEAVHAYNQSAAKEPAAADWFRASAERFFAAHHGAWFVHLLRALCTGTGDLRSPPLLEQGPPTVAPGDSVRPSEWPLWLEISPRLQGFPAGATSWSAPRTEAWSFPAQIWDRLAAGRYTLTLANRSGAELWRLAFER